MFVLQSILQARINDAIDAQILASAEGVSSVLESGLMIGLEPDNPQLLLRALEATRGLDRTAIAIALVDSNGMVVGGNRPADIGRMEPEEWQDGPDEGLRYVRREVLSPFGTVASEVVARFEPKVLKARQERLQLRVLATAGIGLLAGLIVSGLVAWLVPIPSAGTIARTEAVMRELYERSGRNSSDAAAAGIGEAGHTVPAASTSAPLKAFVERVTELDSRLGHEVQTLNALDEKA